MWLGLAPPDEVKDDAISPPSIPWRSPIAWVLGLLFGLQSMLYYGVVTWLAAVYVERGWSEPDAANLIALFGAVTLVGTAVMPLGADRIGTRRGQLVGSSLLILIGLAGVVALPDPGVLWAVVLGAGMGTIFPIVLTLPVDVGGRPAHVAAIAAMMLLVGYILSAVGALGVRDRARRHGRVRARPVAAGRAGRRARGPVFRAHAGPAPPDRCGGGVSGRLGETALLVTNGQRIRRRSSGPVRSRRRS